MAYGTGALMMSWTWIFTTHNSPPRAKVPMIIEANIPSLHFAHGKLRLPPGNTSTVVISAPIMSSIGVLPRFQALVTV